MLAERRRVAITGIGAVTPIGISREGLWDGLRERRSAVRPVTRFDASLYRSKIAAEIDFHPTDFIEEFDGRLGNGRQPSLSRVWEGVAYLWVEGLSRSGRPLSPLLAVRSESVYKTARRG